MVSFHRYVTVSQRLIVPSIPRARYESCTGSWSNHPTAATVAKKTFVSGMGYGLMGSKPWCLGCFWSSKSSCKALQGSSWIPEFDPIFGGKNPMGFPVDVPFNRPPDPALPSGVTFEGHRHSKCLGDWDQTVQGGRDVGPAGGSDKPHMGIVGETLSLYWLVFWNIYYFP